VARDIDLEQALRGFKSAAYDLDPVRSGLYVRYQLMVAYVVEKKHVDPRALLENPVERDVVERDLMRLAVW
jgi:hypothetical protein